MHVLDRCNKVGYSQRKTMCCLQGETNATYLRLVAILDDVTTKMKCYYYYSLLLQQIPCYGNTKLSHCKWKHTYCDTNQVVGNGSLDIATQTRGVAMW